MLQSTVKQSASSRQSLQFLDGLRGLAALYVVIGHARWLLWEGGVNYRTHMASNSAFYKVAVNFFAVFKYGHEMVLFFFVLSGFVIHLKYSFLSKTGADTSFNFLDYLKRRGRRILPPYLFALALTFVVDYIVGYNNFYIYHHATGDALINKSINFDHSLETFIGNLFFLQNTYVPVFGSNGPLWSLKYEWWFYMLYPVILYFNKVSVWLTLIGVLILSLISIYTPFPGFLLLNQVFAYLFAWWLGGLAADLYNERIKISRLLIYPLILVLCLIPFFEKISIDNSLKDLIIGIGFFSLIILMLDRVNTIFVGFFSRLKPLGDFSYTLYVIHFPILVLINGLLLKYTANRLPESFLYVIIGVLVSVIAAFGAQFLIEKPFTKNKSHIILKTNSLS